MSIACLPPNQAQTLTSRSSETFLTTPNFAFGQYPPNVDCNFLIRASSPRHQIMLTVYASQFEEPLFGDCDDYVFAQEVEETETSNSNHSNSAETGIRWCGHQNPLSITTATNSLRLRMKSDGVYGSRGANISFLEYEVPGCPPGWRTTSNTDQFCYKLVAPNWPFHKVTWVQAQRHCQFDQSNLATITDRDQFDSILDMFGNNRESPWIGIYDADEEGTFLSIVPDDSVFSSSEISSNSAEKDCVFLDLSANSKQKYGVDRCWTERSFLCKRNKSGITTTYAPPEAIIEQNRLNLGRINPVVFWLLGLAVLILFLICIVCLIYRSKRRNRKRVEQVVEVNPPSQPTAAAANSTPSTAISEKNQGVATAGIENRAFVSTVDENSPSSKNQDETIVIGDQQNKRPKSSDSKESTGSKGSKHVQSHGLGTTANGNAPRAPSTDSVQDELRAKLGLPPVEKFERPIMKPLGSVSEISLDEYWSNNERRDRLD